MLQVQVLQILQSTISAVYGMFKGATKKEQAGQFYDYLDSLNVSYSKSPFKRGSTKPMYFYIVLDEFGTNAVNLLHEHFANGAIIAADLQKAKEAKQANSIAPTLPTPTLYQSATAAAAAAVPTAVPQLPTVPTAAAVPTVNSIQNNVIDTVEYNRLKGLKRLKPEQRNSITIYEFMNGVKA